LLPYTTAVLKKIQKDYFNAFDALDTLFCPTSMAALRITMSAMSRTFSMYMIFFKTVIYITFLMIVVFEMALMT
jgi:hypothetical protein